MQGARSEEATVISQETVAPTAAIVSHPVMSHHAMSCNVMMSGGITSMETPGVFPHVASQQRLGSNQLRGGDWSLLAAIAATGTTSRDVRGSSPMEDKMGPKVGRWNPERSFPDPEAFLTLATCCWGGTFCQLSPVSRLIRSLRACFLPRGHSPSFVATFGLNWANRNDRRLFQQERSPLPPPPLPPPTFG